LPLAGSQGVNAGAVDVAESGQEGPTLKGPLAAGGQGSKPNPSGFLATPSVVGHARCRPCPSNEVVGGREAPDA
jgi:hypothetical protein